MVLSDVKKIQRRSKESERALARWLVSNDGIDPMYAHIASSTGRIGHMNNLQFDVASNTYDAENKNTVVPAALWKAWKQVCAIAKGHKKEPLLRLEPSNADKKGVPVMHIITEERHKALLASERNESMLIDFAADMPTGFDDLFPNWDWEAGREHA